LPQLSTMLTKGMPSLTKGIDSWTIRIHQVILPIIKIY